MESLISVTLSNSLLAAALVVVALAVSRLLKNKPAVAHVLWLLVLVKLVTPPVFSVPVSWSEAQPTAGQVTPADPMPVVGVDISMFEQHLAKLRAAQISRRNGLLWSQILVGVWCLGSVVWLLHAACRIRRFNRLLKTAELATEDLQTKTLCLAERLGVRRSPRVLLIDAEVPPMVWCVGWIPRILLPNALVAGISPRQLELIVAHELAHVKRRDYLMRWFELMVLAVFWWNPVAWLAVRRLRTAEEHCSDAMVVELNSANARSYVETLVQVVDFLTEKGPVPFLASGIGSSPSLKRRCEMILTNNTSSRIGRLACLLILAIGLAVLPFSVQARAQDNATSSSDLEKRITQLEKLVDNLLKALNSNVPSDSKAAVPQHRVHPPEASTLGSDVGTQRVLAKPVPVTPVSAKPVPMTPVLAKPVPMTPVLAKPVPMTPVSAKPVLAKPVLAKPVLAKPVLAKPVLAKPVLAKPVLAKH